LKKGRVEAGMQGQWIGFGVKTLKKGCVGAGMGGEWIGFRVKTLKSPSLAANPHGGQKLHKQRGLSTVAQPPDPSPVNLQC